MAVLTVEVKFDNTLIVSKEATARSSLAVQKAVKDIEAHAKASMRGSKGGKLYKRGKKFHRASAPGEPPAMDTGALANSIHSYMESALVGIVEAGGPGSPQALALEYGTANGHIAPRPYMRPAVEFVKPHFIETMKHIVK
jgi:hypothetical protein